MEKLVVEQFMEILWIQHVENLMERKVIINVWAIECVKNVITMDEDVVLVMQELTETDCVLNMKIIENHLENVWNVMHLMKHMI